MGRCQGWRATISPFSALLSAQGSRPHNDEKAEREKHFLYYYLGQTEECITDLQRLSSNNRRLLCYTPASHSFFHDPLVFTKAIIAFFKTLCVSGLGYSPLVLLKEHELGLGENLG